MVDVDIVSTRAQLEAAFQIRLQVFVEEQNVPLDEEIDEADTAESTVHVLATDEEGPLATARLIGTPSDLHIGRVAVLRRGRGAGIGSALMAALEKEAVERYGPVRVSLSAQEQVTGFYAGLGYRLVDAERYLDAGIWHRDMVKDLTSRVR